MTNWLKTISASLCILTILLHLIPRGKFAKYVQFYGGLLFFLVAAEPVWEIFAGEGELERLLQLEFLKEEYYDLETSAAGLAEMKNEQITTAYQQEIQRQMREIAVAYGASGIQVEVQFNEEDGYGVEAVTLYNGNGDLQKEELEKICQEIAGVYALERKKIRFGSAD